MTPDLDEAAAASSLSCDTLRSQHRLFLALSQVRNLPETLRLCLDSALQVSGMECGGIYLREHSYGLRLAHAVGLSGEFVEALGWHAADTTFTRQVLHGTPLYEWPPDWDNSLAEWGSIEGLRSFALLPIWHKQQVIGCVVVTSRKVEGLSLANRFALETMASLIGLLISESQADEALRASEARFEATFEQAAVGIAQLSLDGRWLRVNRKLCEILGYSRGELLALDFQSFIPQPDTAAADIESVRQLLANEIDSYAREKRYRRKDGSFVWINHTVSLARKPNGEPDYIIAVVEDIQARKLAEEVLRRFSRVIEQTASTIIITDNQGVIQYVNPRFVESSGYSVEEAIGKTPGLLKSGLTTVDEYRLLWRTIQGGDVWKGELCNRHRDGSLYWVSTIISPVRDEQGQITNFVGIHDDISERKQAEEALKESEAVLRKAQRMARIGNWKRDLRANTAMWSDTIYRILGRDPSLPPATFTEMAQYFTPESWEQLWAAIDKAIHDGTPYDVDAEVVRADGYRRWVHSHGEVGYDDSGAIIELNGMVQDITERKVAEQAQQRLARALKLLSQCRMALVHAQNEQQLLVDICRHGVKIGGYLMAWVGYAEDDAAKTVRPVAYSGHDEGYLDSAKVTWADTERGRGPTGTAIRNGITVVTHDYLNNPKMAPWREAAAKRGYQSSIALPLIVNQRVLGALNIYSAEPFGLGQEEVALLEELACDLAYGIDTLRNRIERKRAEAALAEREAQYHAVIDTTTDGFWIVGAQGRLLAVNDAYVRRSGYSREELLTMRISDLEAQESTMDIQAHVAKIQRVGTDLFESQHRTKAGDIWPVEINAAYWPEAGGRIFVFVRDINQRKILERQIIEVSTAEQERIGREIHDGIGQQLTAVGMLANSLERKLTQTQQLEEAKAANALVLYLQQLVGSAKSLARGLSPIQIGPDGFADALSLLVDGVRTWSGVDCRLAVSGEVGPLDEIVAVHLYRITQEAINNAIKHGHGDTIEVYLQGNEQRITLSVHDNGTGIDLEKKKTTGLGLHIMRYRAGIIGATFSINPVVDGGTLVECVWYRHS